MQEKTQRTTCARVLRWAAGIAAAGALLGLALPALSGVGRTGALTTLLRVPGAWLLGLGVLWLAGLATHTVVTNVWDVLAKLLLAAVVLPLVAVSGGLALGVLGGAVAAVGVTGALVAGTALACVVSRCTAGAVGAGVERAVAGVLGAVGSSRRPALAAAVLQLHDESNALVRRRWGRLSAGMAGYTLLLFCLWWACLHVVGLPVALALALLAFVVERLATLAGLTPAAPGSSRWAWAVCCWQRGPRRSGRWPRSRSTGRSPSCSRSPSAVPASRGGGGGDAGGPGAGERFCDADVAAVAHQVAAVLREERAEVLVGYDPAGGYGHPDHRQVHRVARAAAREAGTPRLLEVTVDRRRMRPVLALLALLRPVLPVPDLSAVDHGGWTRSSQIDLRLDVRDQVPAKQRALRAHASQTSGGIRTVAMLAALPGWLARRVLGTEWFLEVPDAARA